MNDQAIEHYLTHGMLALGRISDRLDEMDTPPPLSFRDQAALFAMNSLLPIAHVVSIAHEMSEDERVNGLAHDAFDIADAMEAERLKRIIATRIAAEEAMSEATK